MDTQGGTPLDIADCAGSAGGAGQFRPQGLGARPNAGSRRRISPCMWCSRKSMAASSPASSRSRSRRRVTLISASQRRAHCADPGQIAALAEKAHAQVNLRRKAARAASSRPHPLDLSRTRGPARPRDRPLMRRRAPSASTGSWPSTTMTRVRHLPMATPSSARLAHRASAGRSRPITLRSLPCRRACNEALEAQWGAPEEDPRLPRRRLPFPGA